MASQMADAVLEKTQVDIGISKAKEKLIAAGEVIKFDGFLKLYNESTDDDDDDSGKSILPPLNVGQKLDLNKMQAVERFTKHSPRYTEPGLVKKLEELGIGRPSTYAPTISVIQKREYVVKESREGEKRNYFVLELRNSKIIELENSEMTGAEKNKLFPTDLGVVVNNYLVEYFNDIIDYSFTAKIEKEFDEIAQNNIKWEGVIKDFYWPFHKKVDYALEKSEKASGERLLGKDPVSGKNVYARIGRFGPMAQIGESNEEEKPTFAGLMKNQSIDSITLSEALELFKLPRKVGLFEDKEIVAAIGRFGPYLRHDSKFVSLPKTDDPHTVDLDRAIEIIKDKREAEIKKIIKKFDKEPDVIVLIGRWGPYISFKGENLKIPKTYKPEELTLEDCIKIKNEGGATSSKKPRTTKSATKKVTKVAAKTKSSKKKK
jgi:DNA topoisomerase I